MVRRAAAVLLILCVSLSATVPAAALPAAQPVGPSARYFGAVQAMNSPERASQAGVQWERVIFHWKDMQPTGPDDWRKGYFSDEELAAEVERGREVVGVVLYTPPWASSTPERGQATDVPANLYLPYDDPRNYWGQFMFKLASRYRGQVDTWILWNEPDQYNAEVRNTWNGTDEDLYQLIKVGYLAVKAGNPDARVSLPGFTYFWDKENNRPQTLHRLLHLMSLDPTAAENSQYFDIVNVHVYGNPLNAYAIPETYRRLLANYGLQKPIWITESNAVPYDDPLSLVPPIPFRASMDQQAAYIVQAFALGRAAGLEKMSVYKMVDEFAEGQGDLYGLVRNDGSARPAFTAYQTVVRYMSGTLSAVYTWDGAAETPTDQQVQGVLDSLGGRHQWPWPAAVNRVTLERSADRVTVVWNGSPNPATARVPAVAERATRVDKLGTVVGELVAQDGFYTLDLPPSSNNTDPREPDSYLVGGDPFLLVEQVEPLPAAVDAPIEVVWPHNGAPISEADQANISAFLFVPGTTQPVPCRWNPRVTLMVSTDGGPARAVGQGTRNLLTTNGITYPVWAFDNVDVSSARQGATLEFWLEVDGVPTTSPRWRYGVSTPQPSAWQHTPAASCR